MGRGIRDEDDEEGGFEIGEVRATACTEKSMHVEATTSNEHFADAWIPHSQVHENSEVYCHQDLVTKKMKIVGAEGKLIITAWLARERGWNE